MALSQCALMALCEGESKLLKKAEIAFRENHVQRFTYDPQMGILKGSVKASMKKKDYDVELRISDEGDNVQFHYCTCPRGNALCHHVVTMALFGIYNVSTTDRMCQWKQPKQCKKRMAVEELFPPPNNFVARETPDIASKEREIIYNNLRKISPNTGMCWLLEPEAEVEEDLAIKSAEEIIREVLKKNDGVCDSTLSEELKKTEEDIQHIAKLTKGQNLNPSWYKFRKYVITASVFGQVIKQYSYNTFPPSLFKTLFGEYNLDKIKAVQWGINHEDKAISECENKFGVTIEKTGLILDSCGFIGASPDGLVGADTIIEVKCPYSLRDSTVTNAMNDPNFFLWSNDSGNIVLNLSTKQGFGYYHQVQGNLFISGRKMCDFVVWTPKEMLCIRIEKDPTYVSCINMIKEFYQKIFIPKVIDKICEHDDK